MRRRGRAGEIGGGSGSSRGGKVSACVLIGSIRREAVGGGALEGGERGAVADQGLHAARLGSGERGLRIGQLDAGADAGPVSALGEREVLARLLEALVGHD